MRFEYTREEVQEMAKSYRKVAWQAYENNDITLYGNYINNAHKCDLALLRCGDVIKASDIWVEATQ